MFDVTFRNAPNLCQSVVNNKCVEMALKLSPQEKKDLDKYSKFLAFKTAQIIVQSRLGEKVYTQCTPKTSQNDWVCFLYLKFLLFNITKSCFSNFSSIWQYQTSLMFSLKLRKLLMVKYLQQDYHYVSKYHYGQWKVIKWF